MSDEFSKQAGNAIQAAVTGAAALVTGPAGVGLAVGTAVTFNIFEALAARNDEALREFRVAALEEEMVSLRDKLRALESRLLAAGKVPDRQDPLTQNALASEFVRGVSEARTSEKREAIVNATVHQFDPGKGPPAIRDYWLRRVRDLHEPQLSLVLLIGKHGRLGFIEGAPVVFDGQQVVELDMPRASARALFTMANTFMQRPDAGRLIETGETLTVPHGKEKKTYLLHPFKLSEDGEILISFCKDD